MRTIWIVTLLICCGKLNAAQISASIETLRKGVQENSYSNPGLAIEMANALFQINGVDDITLSEVKSEEAYAYFAKGEYFRSLNLAQDALRFARSHNSDSAAARAHNVIGNCFYVFSAFDVALNHYIEAEQLYSISNEVSRLNGIYNNMANIFVDTRNWSKAEEYYKKNIEFGKNSDDALILGTAYLGLGNIYTETKKYAEAQKAYEAALGYYQNKQLNSEYGILYGAFTSLNQKQKKYAEALLWSEKRLQFLESSSSQLWRVAAFATHADILIELGRLKDAERFIDVVAGLNVADESLEAGALIQSRMKLAEKRNDLKNAVDLSKRYADYMSLRYSKDAATRVSVIEAAFQNERKQREIEALTSENTIKSLEVERQRYLWWLTLGVAAIVLVIFLFIFYRWRANVLLSEQMQLNRKLQEIDKLKDRILANTSHELRTPLNGIVGLSELLLSSRLPSDEKEHVQMIAECGRRLASVVDDLLDFASLKEQAPEGKSVPFNLGEISQSVMAVTSAAFLRDELHVDNRLTQHLPLVYAEPHRVQQILTNLLSNALKFTEKGSIIIDAIVLQDFIKIRVRDTGIGIAKEKLDSIFDAFMQVDNSTTRGYHGVGLGLTIVKELTQRYGGTVGVESQPSVGSLFWFTLPLYRSTKTKPSTALASLKRSQLA